MAIAADRRTWLLNELRTATLESLEKLRTTPVREMIDIDAYCRACFEQMDVEEWNLLLETLHINPH